MRADHSAAKPQPQWGDRNGETATGRHGEKSALIEWIRDVSSKILAKLREVEPQ
jgi:hypothetical protein